MSDKINFEIIKKEIDKWDPIDLLNHAPPDEYNIESMEISSKFEHNAEQNGMIIYEVFSEAFGITFTKSIDECICIAKKMMEREQSKRGGTIRFIVSHQRYNDIQGKM